MDLCLPPGALLSTVAAAIFMALSLLAGLITRRSGKLQEVDLDELWADYADQRSAEGVAVTRTAEWESRQRFKQRSLDREARALRLLALCALLIGVPLSFLLASGRQICFSI